MADNVQMNAGSGGDIASADQITTLNGAGIATGEKAQRVKMGFGVDGTLQDVTNAAPLPVNMDSRRVLLSQCRANSFRIPGRAGTAGQKLLAIFNAVNSTILVDVEKVSIDTAVTVIKAVTVLPPHIRLYRVSAAPTGGSAVTKVLLDTTDPSSASVTMLQDASADGTVSGTALAATLTTGNFVTQTLAPRLITAAGYEMFDRIEFMDTEDERVTLRAGEGLVVALDYTLATQNPVTDMWTVNLRWTEYTAG